jgi:hypothetical protein
VAGRKVMHSRTPWTTLPRHGTAHVGFRQYLLQKRRLDRTLLRNPALKTLRNGTRASLKRPVAAGSTRSQLQRNDFNSAFLATICAHCRALFLRLSPDRNGSMREAKKPWFRSIGQ